jgi:hypothetical protein
MTSQTEIAHRRQQLYGGSRKEAPAVKPHLQELHDRQAGERSSLIDKHRRELANLDDAQNHERSKESTRAPKQDENGRQTALKAMMARHAEALDKLKKKHAAEREDARRAQRGK